MSEHDYPMPLVEMAGTYPEDDDLVLTEADADDSWERYKMWDLNEMDEWDYQEWFANACCPDSIVAARRFCGCGGSGQLPDWVRRNWEMQECL